MDIKLRFEQTLQRLLGSIMNRNLEDYASCISKNEPMYTIVQNGHAFKTPEELIAVHEAWFKDLRWVWEGKVIHTVVGQDMAMALIMYEYRAKVEEKPFSNWLTYVFRLEGEEWRLIHDQSTALDFMAFAKSAGIL